MIINNLEDLFDIINDKVELFELKDCMELLKFYNGFDWEKFIEIDQINSSNSYRRRKIYISDRIEMVLITWSPYAQSLIHDHPENGCILKILEGNLIEHKYVKQNNQLIIKESSLLHQNSLGYNSTNDLHQIVNLNNYDCYSLHIYSPPNYEINYYNL